MASSPESTLRALRRTTFGTVDEAAHALGISRWTLHRAEHGGAVGSETQRKIAEVFGIPWRTLMRPFIDQVIEEAS
jgi:DNA-binding XRE family transcriptional regulator